MLFAVVFENPATTFHNCFQMYGTRPNLLDIPHSFSGIVHLQVNPFMAMIEIKFTSIFIVRLSHKDEGLSKIRQRKEQLLLDCLEVPVGNDVGS
jgi:hypothetical protein